MLCADNGLCDCVNTYEGSGEYLSSAANLVTFSGVWKLKESDCNEELQRLTWIDENEMGYHSFVFSENRSTLDSWVAHKNEADTAPFAANARERGQWYITQMFASFDSMTGVVEHSEVQLDPDPLTPTEITHAVRVTLEK
jgi:hypothetical protein